MSSYKWELKHECDVEDVETILKKERFREQDEEKIKKKDVLHLYAKTVNNWNDLEAKIKEGKIVFDFYWMGQETTQVYYDYLMASGAVIGRLMVWLDQKAEE